MRLFPHVPFGVCFVVLQPFTLGSLKELAVSDGGLCSLSLGCEWGWCKKCQSDRKVVPSVFADAGGGVCIKHCSSLGCTLLRNVSC